VSLDGTKIYANASKSKFQESQQIQEQLEKKISSFFDQAEEIDSVEDEEYGEENLDHIPEELRTKE